MKLLRRHTHTSALHSTGVSTFFSLFFFFASQFNTIYGATIDENIVGRKWEPPYGYTDPQVAQYLRYWRTRSRDGAWADNADINGHAAANRRAGKADP